MLGLLSGGDWRKERDGWTDGWMDGCILNSLIHWELTRVFFCFEIVLFFGGFFFLDSDLNCCLALLSYLSRSLDRLSLSTVVLDLKMLFTRPFC